MGGAASPTCAACGHTFAWAECYLARSTPGLAPPAGLGEWGGRTYCPGCGTVVTEWLVGDWQGGESWEWHGRNAPLNTGRALPPSPIQAGWGLNVPTRLLPLHEETTLDVAAVERVTAEVEAERHRVVPDAARELEAEAKRIANDGDLVGAASKIEEALALGLSRPAAARALGELGVELAVERDDPDEGIRLCRRSTAIWPEACWQAHAVVALFLNANGDATGARKAYGDARRYAGTRWWEPRYELRLVERSRTWLGRAPGALVTVPTPEPVGHDGPAARREAAAPMEPAARADAKPSAQPAAREAPGERAIRVFVSSTFLDMQAERDELVKHVFPRLRAICEERNVAWSDVDLRWGITDERRGEVLEICLAEIRACRPYFVGLIGERYGWVPDAIPPELIDDQPWLEQHRESSVTELEVRHGVLNDPAMAAHAFFYLRDPAYVATIPEETRHLYEEVASDEESARLGPEVARATAQRRRERLAELKARIRASGLPVREYPGPRALGELVLRDLAEVVDREFPADSEPSPLAREAAAHDARARWLRRGYVERTGDLEALDEHASGNGPPLVVTGEAGAGKSALLAAWIDRHRRRRPDQLPLAHFVGAGTRSSDWGSLARRILAELNARLGLGLDYPSDPWALRARFADALTQAAARGRLVLVLDGLDQLEDGGTEGGADWLPNEIPANVRLIVSAGPGLVLDQLAVRSWPTLKVAPLAPDERSALIAAYLARSAKTLEPVRLAAISAAPQAASPLYLRTLLEELRQFGVRERLDERIAWYLEAGDLADLLERALTRWEADFERDRPGLVGAAMSLLWAARRGLAEAELRDLLGDADGPLPQAAWSPLYLAAGELLATRDGSVSIAQAQLRSAVEHRYVADDALARVAHLRLAGYFEAHAGGERRNKELPWQLARAGAWERLARLLADPDTLADLWRRDEFETQAYWAQLEANSGSRMVAVYRPVLDAPEDWAGDAWQVAALLRAAGHVAEALALYEHLAAQSRAAGNARDAATALGNAASCRAALGDPEGALAAFREQERLSRELSDGAGLMRSLENQAAVLAQRGEYGAAIPLYETVERQSREQEDRATLVVALGNHAAALRSRGDVDEALALHREQEVLAVALGNREQLAAALDGLGTIAVERGEPRRALELFEREERILRELGNRLGLPVCLGNQGLAHLALGDRPRAMELLLEMERLCRDIGDRRGVGQALGRQGTVLLELRDLDGAMRCFDEHEQVCRDLGLRHELEVVLGNKALILRARGDLAGAMALHEEKARICREIGDRRGLAIALGNQGNIRASLGDHPGAMALYEEKERIDREIGNVSGLAQGLYNRAALLLQLGRVDDAEHVLEEQEHLARQVGHPEKLARSLMARAQVLIQHRNQPGRALPLVDEAYRLATASGNQTYANDIKQVLDILRTGA